MSINDQIRVNGVQYRLQYRKCGKAGCKCNTGEGHGPYWYSYDGNSAAKYVGIHLPEHITAHVTLVKASGAKLKAIKTKINKQRDEAQEALEKAERELRAVNALETGEYAASAVLTSLGLGQFNGHAK